MRLVGFCVIGGGWRKREGFIRFSGLELGII